MESLDVKERKVVQRQRGRPGRSEGAREPGEQRFCTGPTCEGLASSPEKPKAI